MGEMAVNPKYYERMSDLLDALIAERKRQALGYKAYLSRLVTLTTRESNPAAETTYPLAINTAPHRALFDNLQDVANLEARLILLRTVAEVRVGATAALSGGARAPHGASRGEAGGLARQSIPGTRSAECGGVGARRR